MDQWTGRQSSGSHPSWIEKRKNNFKNKDSLRNLWDNIKHINIHIIGFQKVKKEREGQRTYLKS